MNLKSSFIIVTAVLMVLAGGCSMIKLKKEVRRSQASTILVGRISAESVQKGMIIAAAYSFNEGTRDVVHYTVLHEAGEYELIVPKGEYVVCAFLDENSNLIYDDGEPAGQYGGPSPVSAPAGGVVLEINFNISCGPSDIDLPVGSVVSKERNKKLRSRQAGAIVKLDDVRFHGENGRMGFWEPFHFFEKIGGNIFFLEKYDPDKIPVLFIHGAGGTPKEWEYFVNHIDRKRFQPWLFYYPSGARIKAMSYLLFWKLYNLQIKHKFDSLYVTAHSMGGLVARSLIMDYRRDTPYIKLFIALSTPWGGDPMAELGVKKSPAVIPSWIDMQPDGEFFQSLYRDKLPDRVAFYMFIGHRGSRNPFRQNNDGTINLDSLMDLRPQADARMQYAFNEDHKSIINSQAVLAQYNTILNSVDQDSKAESIKNGYIRVQFTYDFPMDGIRPGPIFILRPQKKGVAEIHMNLSPNDSGRRLGPFPAGNYTASLMAPAVRPDRHQIPVSIIDNGTHDIKFTLKPDGMIYGYVTAAPSAQDRVAGMPAEQFLPGKHEVTLKEITLKGAGIERRIRYLKDVNLNYYDFFLSSNDYCSKSYFNFFGLPAGEYEIRITAQGFRPYLKTYSVKPGRQMHFRSIELIPEK